MVGALEAGKSRLIALVKQACLGETNLIKARVEPLGLAPSLLDRLKDARWIESPGYPRADVSETRRDRYQREASVLAAAESDLLVLVVGGSNEHGSPTCRLPMTGTDGSVNTLSARCRRAWW